MHREDESESVALAAAVLTSEVAAEYDDGKVFDTAAWAAVAVDPDAE